jgi:adenine-specific DNA-methyltransferase
MQNLLDELKDTLSADERLVVDGQLVKNKIVELGLKLDAHLLELLLSNERLKEHFFRQVNDTYVFDKQEFQRFVSNKQFLPDSYTAFKNKIGLSNGRDYIADAKEVVLSWPYKDCVLEGGQIKEDTKRNEIFWNETLAPDQIDRLLDPKVLTAFKKYDDDGEHEVGDISTDDNLLFKGNNLLALHSIEKIFTEKIKLIYIDPPFNIGTDDFEYNDNFNHSTWLTFIRNRLEVAKRLLSEDGAIFIHIDHHEMAYLNILLDEVFDRENFVQLISVKSSSPAGFKTVNPGPIDVTEYILFYTKNRAQFNFRKGYVPVGYDGNYNLLIKNYDDGPSKWKLVPLRNEIYRISGIEIEDSPQASAKNAEKKWGSHWKIIREEIMSKFALENAERVVSVRDPQKPSKALKELQKKSKKNGKVHVYEKEEGNSYVYNGGMLSFYSNKVMEIAGELTSTELLTDLWSDISWDGIAREGGVKLKNGKKPERLLQRIIELTTEEGERVLDFFLGSGTTCAVAHKLNRKYIGIEQLNYGKNDALTRLQNVINGDTSGISKYVDWQGGGSFKYAELMQYNEQFIAQIENAESTEDVQEIWNKMKQHAFLSYQVNPSEIDENAEDFEALSLTDQKKFLVEVLDKNQLYVNYSEIENGDYEVSESDKKLNHQFYQLSEP